MKIDHILDHALANDFFRRVLITGEHSQLVLMNLKEGEEIGSEVHHVDQILFFVEGQGKAVLNGEETSFEAGDMVFVPAGATHNFINTGSGPLKLYTVYSPPEHKDGTVHETKEQAEAAEQDHT